MYRPGAANVFLQLLHSEVTTADHLPQALASSTCFSLLLMYFFFLGCFFLFLNGITNSKIMYF